MRFPFAIGAVVVGVPTTCQTPLSGHVSPVLAVLPTAMVSGFSWLPVLRVNAVSLLSSYKQELKLPYFFVHLLYVLMQQYKRRTWGCTLFASSRILIIFTSFNLESKMPANKNFVSRIAILDECLRNRRRKWTLQDLIDTVNEKALEQFGSNEVKKRTIQDDISYLEYNLGAPIERRREGRITYFSYSDPDYSIKNLPISQEEIGHLKDAVQILKQVNDFKILDEVDVIVNKLQNTIDTNVPDSYCIIQFEKHTVALGMEYIDDLFCAIKDKTTLRISYQPFNATEPSQFIFHPYLLKEYRNRWFLFGRRDSEDKLTNLALDRIKEIKNSQAEFIVNDLFDPEIYFKFLIGVTVPVDEHPQLIRIAVTKAQAPYIKTKPIHHSQQVVKEYKDGKILIELTLLCNFELRSVLMGFGGELDVLEPQSLRQSMKELFQSAASVYS